MGGAPPKVVLVTGSRRGIGRAVASRFLREGWVVALNDIEEPELEQTRDTLSLEGTVSAHLADIGDRTQVETMIEEVNATHGRLDVLVNNAATIRFAPFPDYQSEDFEATIRTNLLGAFYCTQAVTNRWIADKSAGNVVMISSVSAHQARPGHAAYGASKAGLELMAKVTAMELAPHGIRVNCVAPGGPVMTEMVKSQSVGRAEPMRERVPLGRLGEPDEVAGVVFFLTTAEASFMTGAVLTVDGGVSLGRPLGTEDAV
jgi:NAD(P)-dependent dehydrogenase (short-subunit alcohol dehydrogenase family)